MLYCNAVILRAFFVKVQFILAFWRFKPYQMIKFCFLILLNHIWQPNLKKWTKIFLIFLSTAIITAKPTIIWVVSKNFFQFLFYSHNNSETTQYLISFRNFLIFFFIFILTVKLCSLPYVSKNFSKNFSTLFFCSNL